MDYGSLINRAFKMTWDNKILWVLGFLSASISGANGLDNIISKQDIPELQAFHIGLIILFILFALVIGLIFLVLQLISIAGLIKAVIIIEKQERYTLGSLFRIGANFFWRFLGLFAVFLLMIIGITILLILPIILGFAIADALGILVLVFIIPLAFCIIFTVGSVYSIAQREIVLENKSISVSLSNAFYLLKKNIGPNIIIFLIFIFLFIGMSLIGLLLLAIFALPTIYVGTQSTMYLIITIVVVAPILILIFIILSGFLGTFFNVLFTLFYQELKKITPPKTAMPDMTNPIPGM